MSDFQRGDWVITDNGSLGIYIRESQHWPDRVEVSYVPKGFYGFGRSLSTHSLREKTELLLMTNYGGEQGVAVDPDELYQEDPKVEHPFLVIG